MKLKYYLRGLAVGMLLSTIILTIANMDKRPLSDAEIRARAVELGMVDRDSIRLQGQSNQSNDTAATGKQEETAPENKTKEEVGVPETGGETGQEAEGEEDTENGSEENIGSGPEENAGNESGEDAGSGSEADARNESGEDAGTIPEADAGVEVNVDHNLETAQTVTFTISHGASSYSVSKGLVDAGLLNDVSSFDNFLCDNGYSRKIRAGTYELKYGMSEKEIAEIIAH